MTRTAYPHSPFALRACLALSALMPLASAQTVFVGPASDPDCDYHTIQDAIDAWAASASTDFVSVYISNSQAYNAVALPAADGDLRVEAASDVAEEYYASFTIDRSGLQHLGLLSARGGVDIEEVATTEPGAIVRRAIDPATGLTRDDAAVTVLAALGLVHDIHDQAVDMLLTLYRAFTEGDAELVEVNPLVVTADRRLLALDAKVSLDDSARFRHPEWDEYRATQVLDERERLAREKDLQYIGLDGSVGIIANGAGLAMSTLDVVNQVGGRAANFLDIGGGANADVMAAALEVINHDGNVKAILVNIFGGITRGEEVATGIVEALRRVDLRAPIVIRLDGTNAEEGRAILEPHLSDSLRMAPDMLSAARTAVSLAGGQSK